MKRFLTALAVFVALLAIGSSSATAAQHQPLRTGDRGQRVRDVQWLLSGHRPSVYRQTIHPYRGKIDGVYGRNVAKAVRDAKWRLGYPKAAVNGRAGKQLFQFLLGKRARPLGWIGRASKRVNAAIEGQTSFSSRLNSITRRELGVHEIPDGSNDGPRVHVYQTVTGAYRAPWCASFVQWALKTSGYGTIANRSAGVFYIVNWAHERTMLHALPRPGALVAYLSNLGHIGVVERVTKTGFYSIEGNTGNAVRRHWHPTGYQRTVFIWLPRHTQPLLGSRTATPPMQAAYVLAGGPRYPNQAKARELGVNRIGWEADDPQIDPAKNGGVNVIEQVRANGFTIFLGRDPVWDNYALTPEQWAAKFSSDITRLGLEGKQCALLADVERHDSAWVLRALQELRRLRPGRGLTWTMEPRQGGIISDELVAFINADPMVTVSPQLYLGGMIPVSERWTVDDLVARGIKPEKIVPFYGQFFVGFSGFLYDLNYLK